MGHFEPPSKDRFAELVMVAIRKMGQPGEIVYDKDDFRLRGEGEHAPIIFLGNVYQQYCSAPASQRETLLKQCARGWFIHQRELPEDFEDIKPDLFPAVRSRSYFELTHLQMTAEGHKGLMCPYQTLAEDLAVGLVYDLPDSMRTISQDDLDGWGVGFYEALEVARDNLRQLPQPFACPESGRGVHLSASNDGYESSRLILPELIRLFQVKGDPIAMVPNRGTLVVAGADDEEGLAAMVALAKEGLQQPRPLSGIALRLGRSEWAQWLPPSDHPQYGEFRILQLQSYGQDYGEQKELLDKLHQKTGDDEFVANYSALQDKQGRILSYAVWGKGVRTLLPRTDLVGFMREDGPPVMAEFDRVLAEVGHLMEPVSIYPPRYRVKDFPTDEELAAMGEEVGS